MDKTDLQIVGNENSRECSLPGLRYYGFDPGWSRLWNVLITFIDGGRQCSSKDVPEDERHSQGVPQRRIEVAEDGYDEAKGQIELEEVDQEEDQEEEDIDMGGTYVFDTQGFGLEEEADDEDSDDEGNG